MNKKLVALALAGAAAWLFNTKKGKEVRTELGKKAGELSGKVKEQMNKGKSQVAESLEG